MKTLQGASVHTERKEFEIEGLSTMRFNQFKNPYFVQNFRRVICADVFCGTGENVIGGEVVDGSPVRIVRGTSRAKNANIEVNYFFSDIREEACDHLKLIISGHFGFMPNAHALSASDAICLLTKEMERDRTVYLFLVLDPNGPKDFPKDETENLLSRFSNRVDVIPYISATAINRCIGARTKAGMSFATGWLNHIENFDAGFISSLTQKSRGGWIRKPENGDRQKWTMIPTFGRMCPKHNWERQGYVDLKSEQGIEAINIYCGGVK